MAPGVHEFRTAKLRRFPGRLPTTRCGTTTDYSQDPDLQEIAF